MSNPIRDKRLKKELQQMEKLSQESSMFKFKVISLSKEYPDKYQVEFSCLGLENAETKRSQHQIEIYLPMDFPRKAPVLQFKTPIFHPNIRGLFSDEELDDIVNKEGGVNNFMGTITENEHLQKIFDAYVCLDVLAENWSPDYSLYDICVELAGMIQLQRYNLADPLNRDAAAWTHFAEKQGNLPIDKRDFRDRLQHTSEKKDAKGTPKVRLINNEGWANGN